MLRGFLAGAGFGALISAMGLSVGSLLAPQPAGNVPPSPPQVDAPELGAPGGDAGGSSEGAADGAGGLRGGLDAPPRAAEAPRGAAPRSDDGPVAETVPAGRPEADLAGDAPGAPVAGASPGLDAAEEPAVSVEPPSDLDVPGEGQPPEAATGTAGVPATGPAADAPATPAADAAPDLAQTGDRPEGAGRPDVADPAGLGEAPGEDDAPVAETASTAAPDVAAEPEAPEAGAPPQVAASPPSPETTPPGGAAPRPPEPGGAGADAVPQRVPAGAPDTGGDAEAPEAPPQGDAPDLRPAPDSQIAARIPDEPDAPEPGAAAELAPPDEGAATPDVGGEPFGPPLPGAPPDSPVVAGAVPSDPEPATPPAQAPGEPAQPVADSGPAPDTAPADPPADPPTEPPVATVPRIATAESGTPDSETPDVASLPSAAETAGPDAAARPSDPDLADLPDGAVIVDIIDEPEDAPGTAPATPPAAAPGETADAPQAAEGAGTSRFALSSETGAGLPGQPVAPAIQPAPEAGAPDAAVAEAATPPAEEAPALERFSADFEAGGRPLMSVVLLDAGRLGNQVEVLNTLPFPVTIAVDPALPSAAEDARRYRAAGYEVGIAPPIPPGATAQDIAVILEAALAAVPEAAVLVDTGAGLQSARSLEFAMALLADEGLGFVSVAQGLNTALREAEAAGVPATVFARDLDLQDEDARVIRRFLERSAFQARQGDGVALLARLRPDTISALILWQAANRDAEVAVAPISALLLAQDDAP